MDITTIEYLQELVEIIEEVFDKVNELAEQANKNSKAIRRMYEILSGK